MSRDSGKVLALALVIVAGAWTGCTRQAQVGGSAPHDVLASYIGEVFAVKSIGDLDHLKKFTLDKSEAGNELDALANNEDLFKKTFVDQKIQSVSSLRIRDERKVGDNEYSITYELTYIDQTASGGSNTVTPKKHVILVRDSSGKWLISEVKNLKTFIEHTTDENISATLKK